MAIALGTSALALCGATPARAATTPAAEAAATARTSDASCPTTREFITALEYLRSRKEGAPAEAEARKLATQVAQGCAGAASRFARVMDLLADAGLPAEDAAHEGVRFARRTEAETAAFVAIFQHAYLEEYLDLDFDASLQLARSLTVDFDGDILGAREDFERLVEFCVRTKELNLPKPECGRFALRIAKLGQPWSGGIAGPFLTIFDFATAKDGAAIPTGSALQLAEKLVHHGPAAAENFVLGYRYAVSAKGLAMPAGEALKFASRLASE